MAKRQALRSVCAHASRRSSCGKQWRRTEDRRGNRKLIVHARGSHERGGSRRSVALLHPVLLFASDALRAIWPSNSETDEPRNPWTHRLAPSQIAIPDGDSRKL